MNSKLKNFHNLWFVVRGSWFVICVLCLGPSALLYAQNAQVTVPADVTTETIILNPQGSAPSNPVEGEVYYRDDPDNRPYYYGGTPLDWRPFGANRTVATRIVAVRRDPPDEALDSDLTNKTADFICDGTADQVEIQQAIDSLGSNPGVVYLLEGTYNISGSINLDNVGNNDSGKAIIGAGSGTVLRATAGIDVINAQNVSNILISQLRIDGNNKTGTNGIYFNVVSGSKIDKVCVENMLGVWGDGIEFDSSSNNTILGNNIQGNGGQGIHIHDSSSNNTISGNNVQSNRLGIYLSYSSNNTISGNNVQSNQTYGIYLSYSSNNTISDNNVQLNLTYGGVTLYYSSNNTISGNNVQSNRFGLEISYSSNNTISGNNVQSNERYGIPFYLSSNNILYGNEIYDNGGTQGYDAIDINRSSSNLISSNLLFDSGGTGYPINISTTDSNDNYLVGNLVSSWPAGYGRINDLGTNTRYTDKVKITLEPGGYTLGLGGGTLTPTGPTSYLRLTPGANLTLGNPAIANGKSVGDILILENTSTNTVTIKDYANVALGSNPRELQQNDTLTLIWDGNDWIETGYADN